MMQNISGYVIKKTKYRETSLIAEVYTMEQGRVSFLLKGALRENSRYLGAMEYLNLIQASYYRKETTTLYVPVSLDLLEENRHISDNIEYFMLTGELFSYMRRFIPENEPDQELFLSMRHLIKGISAGKGNKAVVYFFLKLLKAIGHEINVQECCSCGSGYAPGYFDYENGKIGCGKCTVGEEIGTESAEIIWRLTCGKGRSLPLEKAAFNRIIGVLRKYINRHC